MRALISFPETIVDSIQVCYTAHTKQKEAKRMGLFDGLKTMFDIVKGGIEAYKATEKLDEIVAKIMAEYKDQLTAGDLALYDAFQALKEKKEAEQDTEKANAMIEEVEKAEVAFLMSAASGEAIPAELKDTVRGALEAYTKANNAPMEILEKRFMAMAKTDEEKAFVQQMMDETKAEEEK